MYMHASEFVITQKIKTVGRGHPSKGHFAS